MNLGWIDFSDNDRKKTMDVLRLFQEQGAVDELGIGVIRDGFANSFFPGTSTIQTRAKYFFIIPLFRYGKGPSCLLCPTSFASSGRNREGVCRYLEEKQR